MRTWMWVALLLLLVSGCDRRRPSDRDRRVEPGPAVTRRVAEIKAQLLGDDPDEHADAIAQVRSLVRRGALQPQEGAELLMLVDRLGVVTGDAGVIDPDLQLAVVDALADAPSPAYLDAIETMQRSLRPDARVRVLELLAALDDPRAAALFLELLGQQPAPVPSDAFAVLRERLPQPDLMVPGLLERARSPDLFFEAVLTVLRYCEQADLTPAPALAPHADWLVQMYQQRATALWPAQRPSGQTWMWTDAYAPPRTEAGLLLDLFGFVDSDASMDALHEALDYRDPRLAYFAVDALLQRGRIANPDTLERVAAYPSTRSWLHDRLLAADELGQFPRRWRTQAALAEATMAAYLSEPGALGRPPDQLELLEVVGDGDADHYVYRFRVEPPSDQVPDGWWAGVAGPFRRADQPTTTTDGGATGSLFQGATTLTPRGHVDAWRAAQRAAP